MLVKLPKCEYCGGTNYEKDNGTFVCLGCHKRYTVEELEKLPMVDVEVGNGPTLEERILRAQKIGTSTEWKNLWLTSGLIDDMEEKYGWERDFYREYCVANEIACEEVPADDSCRSAASFGRRLQEIGLYEKIAKTVPEEELAKVLEEVYKRINEVVNLFFEKETGRYVNNNQTPTEPKEEFYNKLSLDYITYTGFTIDVYLHEKQMSVLDGFAVESPSKSKHQRKPKAPKPPKEPKPKK